MYNVRTQGTLGRNPEQRWGLPERVFFACGTCHIWFMHSLERYQIPIAQAVWIKPSRFSGQSHLRHGRWQDVRFITATRGQTRFPITIGSVRDIFWPG